MIYQSLYRKFRPLTFGEMVGQENITKTLKNQIIENRVGHAYIFSGGRGTGKTSAAKILARAVNCLKPIDGEPCNECEICKSVLAGSLTDVVEMDAASNNSVEDIRSIREQVNFLPTVAKYRVYIIDEAHMLSTGAFNALLKTLEEPPSHVKFILATTEPQKLPATILSRCQRFDFKKIPDEDIIKRLEDVCNQIKIDIQKEALQTIAILSEGAMRDALSILERCIQDGENQITQEKVKDLVGIPKTEAVNKIVEAILNYNAEQAIEQIQIIIDDGKDISNLLWEIIKYIKDMLIYKTSKQLKIYSKEEKEQIKKLVDNVSKEKLLKLIYELSELQNDIKWSTQKQIIFQVGIIKLCNKEENQSLIERIENLEKILEGKQIVKIENSKKEEIKTEKHIDIEKKENNTKKKNQKQEQQIEEKQEEGKNNKNQEEFKQWKNVLENLKNSGKMMLYSNLINTTAEQINDLIIEIQFTNGITPFAKTVLEKIENKNEIEKLVSMEYGKPMKIKYVDKKESKTKAKKSNDIEKLVDGLDIHLNIIEE